MALPPSLPDTPEGIRSQADRSEDPARRASLHLTARAESARLHADSDAAQTLAEQALSVDPRNPWAYLVLARTLAEVGSREEALESAFEAERLFRGEEPRDPAWIERAETLRAALEQQSPSPISPRWPRLRRFPMPEVP